MRCHQSFFQVQEDTSVSAMRVASLQERECQWFPCSFPCGGSIALFATTERIFLVHHSRVVVTPLTHQLLHCSVELGSVPERGAHDVPVLRLDEHVGHPVIVVSQRVSQRLDAQVLPQEAASPGTGADQRPLERFELTSAEVGSHARPREKHSRSATASQSHREGERAPTPRGVEELLLAEKVARWVLDHLICTVVSGIVIAPSAEEGPVEELSALPDGSCKHSWHFSYRSFFYLLI